MNIGLVRGDKGLCSIPATSAARGISICDFCTMRRHCELEAGATCHLFVPPIGFKSPTGLKAKFTTIRMGDAWMGRVKRGSIVGLVQLSPLKRIGLARVKKTEVGLLDDMCQRSGHTNHSYLETDIPKEERPARLKKLVRNLTGSWAYEPGKLFTVIHCERLTPDECKGIKAARTMAAL